MKFVSQCFLSSLFGIAVLCSSLGFGGEGTLPFGKGQVPFSMVGSLESTNPQPLYLNFEPKDLNSSSSRESVECPSWLEFFDFSGNIEVDGVVYKVIGICGTDEMTGERIVTGVFGSRKLILKGILEEDHMGQTFSGTATVISKNRVKTHNFTVNE